MTRIKLSDSVTTLPDGTVVSKKNNAVMVYDTGGPYTDIAYQPSIGHGLPRIRNGWGKLRKDMLSHPRTIRTTGHPCQVFPTNEWVLRSKAGKQITQLYYAKKRIITPEMEYVTLRENQQIEALGLKSYITPEFTRKEIASGRAVIPANINHPELEPMIIGQRFLVKVNALLLPSNSSVEDALRQMIGCCVKGADTWMDLSVAADCHLMREWLIRNSPVPVGTSPLYQTLAKAEGIPENISWALFRDTLVEQAEQGVDFVSIHAAMRKKHIDLLGNRLNLLDSYSGSVLVQWMNAHKKENFLHTHFTEICEILKTYDVTLSLGSGLRAGAIYDANDQALLAELAESRLLIDAAADQYVQTMAEGVGHLPMNKMEAFFKEYQYAYKGTPFFTLGVTVTDIAGANQHIASAIGSAQMACQGASIMSCCKPKNASGFSQSLVEADIVAHKIAAHAADLAKGHPGAQVRDNAYSKAQREGRTADALRLTIGLVKPAEKLLKKVSTNTCAEKKRR